ncbi:MAG: VOC family protein [Vicinamibacterales bacterium]
MAVRPVPEGYHTITPYLLVADAGALLDFVQRAFDGRSARAMRGPDGQVMHADVVIGDSHVMIGQGGGAVMPTMLYLYVDDADALYARAIAAGGEAVQAMTTQFYGDRSGAVRDPAGNQWWIATHVEDVSSEELERRAAEARRTA